MRETVLIVHGDAANTKIIDDTLRNSPGGRFAIEWVEQCAEAVARLQNAQLAPIAAILINLIPPDAHGLETFSRIFTASPDVPILIISGSSNEFVAKQAVELGAQDYLLANDLHGYLLPKALANMIERAACEEILFTEKERVQLTLDSIGDAVVSTDFKGNVTFLNPTAEALTGWRSAEAIGRPFGEVFRITDGAKDPRTVNPMLTVIRENIVAHLPAGCVLIRRDGFQSPIEDSAAPIHDRRGRVTGGVMVFHDVTETRAVLRKMSHLAQHDFLTDLPNRPLLNDRLSQAISAARRQKQHLAVLFVDVDRFKHVNDSLGHMVGDKLLLSIARRLVGGVRDSDTVSRQGGDEFVILLSSVVYAEDAALSAQRILTSLGMPHKIDQHDLQITVSVGIGIYPEDGSDAEALVKSADVAMLNAKDNGRNNYQFFKSHMNEHALKRQSLESALRHALERHEFTLHYQPKMDLATETLIGAEALIRWSQPERGNVCPKDFIPIAEQSGYIVSIGQWVLREACRQRRNWLDAKLAPVPVAVNLRIIAEGVETRGQFLALQGQDCAEGQGYYFQKPVPAQEFIKLLGADLSATVLA